MVTDPFLRFSRRRFLLAAACGASAWLAPPAWAAQTPRLAAAWDEDGQHHVGVLALRGQALAVVSRLAVPTRAHGVASDGDGGIVAVARRPGDWMLRWQPGQHDASWAWAEAGRSFNGHAVLSADRTHLFTSETDLETGAGLIGMRETRSLKKLAEWPTHGIDPHALLIKDHTLYVANGGVPTQPETGRIKRDLHRMDSSLVGIDTRSGDLTGQWRLNDQRLSLRHLARNGALIGIALQAEHDAPERRAAAPLLAVFDGRALTLAAPQQMPPLAGYAGDIAPWQDGFALGAPRAHSIARWRPGAGWQPPLALSGGCALAVAGHHVWAAGRTSVAEVAAAATMHGLAPSVRVDNHWTVLPA